MLDRYIADVKRHYGEFCNSVAGGVLGGSDEFARLRIRSALTNGRTPFQLEIMEGGAFIISKASKTIKIGKDTILRLSLAIYQVRSSDDHTDDHTDDLDKAFLYLFLSHEMLHATQGLSSRWFQDADHFRATVAQVDYAADAAAISFVDAIIKSEPNNWKYLFELDWPTRMERLIAVHLAVMKAFYFNPQGSAFVSPERIRLSRFIRVSTWIYQAARAKAINSDDMAASEFNLGRPVMVEFPRRGLKALGTGWIVRSADNMTTFEAQPETPDGEPPDAVVTSVWPDGIPWIVRFHLPSSQVAAELISGAFTWEVATAYEAWNGLFESQKELVQGPSSDLDKAGILLSRMAQALSLNCEFNQDAVRESYSKLRTLVGLNNRKPLFQGSPYAALIDDIGDMHGQPYSDDDRSRRMSLRILQAAYALKN